MTTRQCQLESDVSLAGLTTLGVGGPARLLATCSSRSGLEEALAVAAARDLETFVLGGGSNVLVADRGFGGMVIRYLAAGLELIPRTGAQVRVVAEAGLSWDALVARTVAAGLGGVEALSGIPGLVGAAPIQNIGAYGQELDGCLAAVSVVARRSGRRQRLAAADCGFGYRCSHFKSVWQDRFVVVGVELDLASTDRGAVRYDDLRQCFAGQAPPTPAAVRQAVLAVRAEKSMVLRDGDPNRRSAGSFFTNPVLSTSGADLVAAAGRAAGARQPMPRWPQADGRVKLSAAWLIEAAGFRRGEQRGEAGLSTRHVLALVNRGRARARDLVALAAEIRQRVAHRFGVALVPEPVFLGFDHDAATLLDDPAALEESP